MAGSKYSIMFDLYEQIQCLTSQKRWSDTPFSFKERNFKTHSLHGASSDKIATTLDHNLMRPSITRGENRVFSPTAHEILSSMVASARCQTIRQLLLKWFSPFKRTRSHVKRGLLAEIRYRIAATNQAGGEETKKCFKAFKKTVPQKLIHKDHLAQLNGHLQRLTKQNDLGARELFNGIDEVFPKSLYMPPEQLTKLRNDYQSAETQRTEDYRLVQGLRRLLNLRESTRTPRSIHTPASSLIDTPPQRDTQELSGTPLSPRLQQASLAQRGAGIEPDTWLDLQELANPLIPSLVPESSSGPRAQELAATAAQLSELHDEPLIELD